MRNELAFRHLLLVQARELASRTSARAHVEELVATLEVEATRAPKAYTVRATVADTPVTTVVPADRLAFYARGDAPETGADVLDDASIDDANAARAAATIVELLESAGVRVEAASLGRPDTGRRSGERAGWVSASALAAGAVALVWYQGSRILDLVDATYCIEIAWRIRSGEIPYRDFTLVLPPGTFAVQAGLYALFGDRAIVGLAWATFVTAATVLLTYGILRSLGTPRGFAVGLCALPAVFGHAAMPYASYDMDSMLLCLVSAWLLLSVDRDDAPVWRFAVLGVAVALPIAFKQNLGLAQLVIVAAMLVAGALLAPWRFGRTRLAAFALGAAATLATLAALLAVRGVLGLFFRQTFLLAGALRGVQTVEQFARFYLPVDFYGRGWLPVLTTLVLVWITPALGCVGWFVGTHRSVVRMLFPFWVSGIAAAAYYAQGFESAWALGPLVAMSLALITLTADGVPRFRGVSRALGWAAAVCFASLMLAFSLSGQRLNFLVQPLRSPVPYLSPRMAGLSVTSEHAKGLDQAVAFAASIPADETIVALPTEDPLYFATGRTSPIRIVQSNQWTGGGPAAYLAELERTRPTWIFEKTNLQCVNWEPSSDIARWVAGSYRPVVQLSAYRLWRRIDAPIPFAP